MKIPELGVRGTETISTLRNACLVLARGDVHLEMSVESMGVNKIARKERRKRRYRTNQGALLLLEK